jgi:catechol-2,3-dioxygenase
MLDPRVNGLRGVELAVFDINASANFYKEIWALEEVSREADLIRLRATGNEHHVLTLHQRPKAGLICVVFAAPDQATVDALHAKAKAFGAAVLSKPAPMSSEAGGGYGFEVRSPEGQTIRISSGVTTHSTLINEKSRPSRLNHVVLNAAAVDNQARFFCDVLGFTFSDNNGHMEFIRCSRNHHSIALAQSEGASLNHVAFEMEDIDALMRGVGRLKLADQEVGWGVGRHAGPGNNVFSYFRDPNGFAIEYTTEVDQVGDDYVSNRGEYWRAKPLRPCAWAGNKTIPTPWMAKAMSGQEIEERNRSCDDVISERLAG